MTINSNQMIMLIVLARRTSRVVRLIIRFQHLTNTKKKTSRMLKLI